MLNSDQVKNLAIALGAYRPMRFLQRAISSDYRQRHLNNLALYGQFLGSDDLAIDVGANIGEKTEAMLLLGARVISLEPQPKLVREIKARCGHFGDRLSVIQTAAGDHEGHVRLHLRESSAQASLLNDWEGKPIGAIDVPLTTLDSIIAKCGVPRLCKIDVEGAEIQVLRGLSHVIELITIEYHTNERGMLLAFECISRINGMWSTEINATCAEGSTLMLPKWLAGSDFIDAFPAIVGSNYFGDLLIRAVA
jgi:FkbM family methyltransferase